MVGISLQNHAAVICPKCHIQNYTKFLHLNKSKTEMILLGQPKRVRWVRQHHWCLSLFLSSGCNEPLCDCALTLTLAD